MNKDRFSKWFSIEPDRRFFDDPVIELTLRAITKISFSKNSATIEYEFWAHDPTTIRSDSALINVPYGHIADSCSEISFPKKIGLYRWMDLFEWKSSEELESLSPNYERTTDLLDVELFDWSDPVIPEDVFDFILDSDGFDKWSLGEHLLKNRELLDKTLTEIPSRLLPFVQACIREHEDMK